MKQNTSGFTILSVLFIIAITSFFVTIVNEQRTSSSENVVISLLDTNIATKIAEIGAQLGLNELKNNLDFATQYTSGNSILDNQSTTTIFGITGGTITLQLTAASGDLSDGPIDIISTGTYNDSTKTITLTINKILDRRMLMIEPVTNADGQFDARKTTFENLGWEITTVMENTITIIPGVLDPILLIPWNMVYLPQNIAIDKNSFTDIESPLTTETISDSAHFGVLVNTIQSDDVFTTTLAAQANSQTHTSGSVITVASINASFKNLNSTDLVASTILEFADASIPQAQQSSEPIVIWLPQNSVRADSTVAPQSRLILNIVPSNDFPWSLYTSDGTNVFNTLLDYVACNYTNCYSYEIYDVQYQ